MRAVIYARISDDRTGLAAGVERQEQDARSLCKRNGWDIVGVEVDNDISASRYSRKIRPAYQRVLAMAAAGEVDVIACYDVDRLYRRPADLEELIDLAERTVIASVQGDLHLDTSDGRAIARVLAAMAAKSSDDTSRRIKRKHEATAQAGLPTICGPRPFGFDDDRVTLRESEAQRIREAAVRILGGDSLSVICRDWASAGVVTSKGNRWETSSLRRMLEAPRVAGLRKLDPEVVAVWPAVLDREMWEAVRATLAGRAVRMPEGYSARSYLLSGLIVCGQCGSLLTASPLTVKGKRYRRYYCRKARGGCGRVGINADRTEAYVTAAALNRLSLRGPVDTSGPIDIAGGAALELARQEARLSSLADSLAAERIDLAAFEAAASRIRVRVNELRSLVLQGQARSLASDLAGERKPSEAWGRMPFDRQRAVIGDVIERVTIVASSGRGAGFESARIDIAWR